MVRRRLNRRRRRSSSTRSNQRKSDAYSSTSSAVYGRETNTKMDTADDIATADVVAEDFSDVADVTDSALNSTELTSHPSIFSPHDPHYTRLVAATNLTTNGVIGSIGLIYAAQRAYLNYQYIVDAKQYLREEIDAISDDEIQSFLIKYPSETTEEAIKNIASGKMLSNITQNTLSPGFASTALMSGIFISLALIFPPVGVPLFIAGMSVLALGATTSIAASISNRYFLTKKLKKLFQKDKTVQDIIRNKKERAKESNAYTLARKQRRFYQALNDNILNFFTTIKVVAVFNFVSSAVKLFTTTMQSVGLLAITAVEAAKNYFQRQEKLYKFSKILSEVLVPKIHAKPYIFFGQSLYEKFISKHRKEIIASLHKNGHDVDPSIPLKKLINYIKFETPKLHEMLQSYCIREHIKKNFHNFCAKRKINPKEPDAFEQYVQNAIASNINAEVRFYGHFGTFTAATCVLTLSSLFPPLFLTGAAVAGVGAFVGGIVTERVRKHEARKFSGRLGSLIRATHNPQDEHEAEAVQLLVTIRSCATEKSRQLFAPETTVKPSHSQANEPTVKSKVKPKRKHMNMKRRQNMKGKVRQRRAHKTTQRRQQNFAKKIEQWRQKEHALSASGLRPR